MKRFLCATQSPIHRSPRLAIAAVRAGGCGVLDTEFCPPAAFSSAGTSLDLLLAEVRQRAGGVTGLPLAGLRLRAHDESLAAWMSHLDRLEGLPHCLVLYAWEAATLGRLLASLSSPGREIWLELRSGKELAVIGSADLSFRGWIGRGSETGGCCGRESAFILCQHLARQSRPFMIQGGIAPDSAAACRLAGAAGVVLDDTLLLLRESFLNPQERLVLAELRQEDTLALGPWENPYRVAARAAFTRLDALKNAAETAEPGPEWELVTQELVGWDGGRNQVWPVGQMAGRAAAAAAQFQTTGKYITAVCEDSARLITTAARLGPLAPESSLARAHATRYPIVQGPMTRVSDNARFAARVAEAGGLPMIALALMRGAQAEALLEATRDELGNRSWAVGILGFVPPELREEQLAAISRVRPPFALIAGGRPDQASQLESLGIGTYIHVSTPELLRLFLDQGARRFVFEGGECGGHTGPLNAFPLWSGLTSVLLAQEAAVAAEIHVLLAGGIHDDVSAGMTSVFLGSLAGRGIKTGVLMGTAYLFTQEVVATGAVLPAFQEEALRCSQTVTIETGPGHRIRCAPTPFALNFEAYRRAAVQAGLSRAQTSRELEQLVTGRARIASKGITRTGGRLDVVAAPEQRETGMFMMGEVAALRDACQSCAALHELVSPGATRLVEAFDASVFKSPDARPVTPVAIIGIGCLAPGAEDAEALWRNLLEQKNCVREIPRERWDWRLYYDADPSARDRIAGKWGAFLDPIPFDPVRFGIPPNSLPSIAITQLAGLETARRALADAGYSQGVPDAELRSKTAVFIGATNTGDLEQFYLSRTAVPLCAGAVREEVFQRLPEWTEESYPGILVNIIAGRISNRFDFSGPNLTVDAACASSLAALDLALRELDSGRSDLALAGGVELDQSPHAFMAFSKTGALSPQGRARVFDEGADGIVLGEASVILVLKRLVDAERDGDRVYAVIRGAAGSSDGKGAGLTAPQSRGQMLAIERAHAQAGTRLSSVELYEAHGTGTAVGDRTELESIGEALRQSGVAPQSCVTGSAKSLIGHTRAAAGMIGLVKAALALHHRTKPPHAGAANPLPNLKDAGSPVCLLHEPRPWLSVADRPRLAGVSAFGFGGANFHAVLEEYSGDPAGPAAPGAADWPSELFLLAGPDAATLRARLELLRQAAGKRETRLKDLAFACALQSGADGPARFAVAASSKEELLKAVVERLENERDELNRSTRGGLAFLFSGQGGQHAGMGLELAVYSGEMRRAFEHSLGALSPVIPWRQVLLPPAVYSAEAVRAQAELLANTAIAQPAIATISCGHLDFAAKLQLKPDRAGGHSFGEFVALHAAGVMGRDDLLRLAEIRGRLMAGIGGAPAGMAATPLSPGELEPFLGGCPEVWISNRNAPRQTVLSGRSQPLEEVLERLRAAGHAGSRLRVSTAFHCPLMGGMRARFEEELRFLNPRPPSIPVHGNGSGEPYGNDPDAITREWLDHLERPVDFVSQIEKMHAAGIRLFVELGPGRVLTGLVSKILAGRPHVALSADGGLRPWLEMLATVFLEGHDFDYQALFAERTFAGARLEELALPVQEPPKWWMDGGRVWREGDKPAIGRQPFLTLETTGSFQAVESPAARDEAGQGLVGAEIYRHYQETMRHFLEQQERILLRMTGWPANGHEVEPRPAIPRQELTRSEPPGQLPPPLPAERMQIITFDRVQLTRKLISLVSERTGYSEEGVRPEQDLEADLGVDSLKRIEILSKFQKALTPELGSKIGNRLDSLTRAKSVHQIVELLMRELPSAGAPIKAYRTGGDESSSRAKRFVMRGTAADLPSAEVALQDQLVLITEDTLGVAREAERMLRDLGVRAGIISRADLLRPESVGERVNLLRAAHGPVRGVLHLAPLGLAARAADMEAWHESTAVATTRLFALLQHCRESLEDAGPAMRIVAASQLGGDWGRGLQWSGSPAAAGGHGILSCLEREYPRLLTKTVDFDDALTPGEMAGRLVNELLATGGGRELGYQNGRRFVFSPEPAPLAGEPNLDWKLPPGAVLLATGGARGITAAICARLAAPGLRIILVGRGGKSRPGTRDEQNRNIQALQNAGALVEYHQADVRLERDFSRLIQDVYSRHGRIDAVLHGAGVIEDRAFAEKSQESFDRVFATKADSTWILGRELRAEGLKWVVLFSSVSGRFGNAGQADYAAGNETMNRLAGQMKVQWPSTRVVAINWGVWSGTGMATPAVCDRLAAQGMVPIEPEEGWQMFESELSLGSMEDVEIVAGAGPWAEDLNESIGLLLQASLLRIDLALIARIATMIP